MINRAAVIRSVKDALQEVREATPDYSGAISFGTAIGTINAALAAEAINYNEYQRLMDLLSNARSHAYEQQAKTDALHCSGVKQEPTHAA